LEKPRNVFCSFESKTKKLENDLKQYCLIMRTKDNSH
jgi:hypothetical protein